MKFTPHGSYYGINKVVYPFPRKKRYNSDHINDAVEGVISYYKNRKNLAKDKHTKICIFDSFFSDTLRDDVSKKLFYFGFKYDFKIEIVLMDPFSKLGRSRAAILPRVTSEISPEIYRSFKGLVKIYQAISSDFKTYNEPIKKRYYKDWVCLINKIHSCKRIKLRFTDESSEVPLFIIGKFSFKGLLYFNTSAAIMPWIQSINDPCKKNDLFQFHLKNFKVIFKNSYKYQRSKKHIFIGYDHNHLILDAVIKICEEINLIPIYYRVPKYERSTRDHDPHIMELMKICRHSIFIITSKRKAINVKNELLSRLRFICSFKENEKLGKNIVIHERRINLDKMFSSNFSKDLKRKAFHRITLNKSKKDYKNLPFRLRNYLNL